ncbi:MAG: glycosyltransferase family 2 protein, partial [Flavobacterium sp.]|uniref:glycosyltransferase family 2 protein n=1 Tax=Flavobacterium sp. TaxID=239 RepID=UPI003BD30EFC
PNEILIIDGSTNNETEAILENNKFQNLQYFKVPNEHRGLTKQRNYGIARVGDITDVICFLDDDTFLEPTYFEELIKTYVIFPHALGVGGYITNEVSWEKVSDNYIPTIREFFYDGWRKKDGSRFVLRKKLGLDTNVKPGFMPEFSNGRSIGCLPPSGKIYEVEQFMGGVASYKKNVFKSFSFSTYFEGYGLYEDADFTLRLSKTGKLYVNTNAQLGHFHDQSGRPNKYQYGKMVVRNGWYVWRVKYPNPSLKAKFKWNIIVILLTFIRFSNIFTTDKRMESFTEFIGRTVGWFSLLVNKPL